jgi:hypothetical protein
VARYLAGPVTAEQIIDGAASARTAARSLLDGSAIAFTGETTPPGCLLASSAISCSAAAEDVQKELAALRGAIEARLRQRITRAVENTELPADTDAEALAGHVMASIQGMSTLARDGASREKLLRVETVAMKAWPPDAPENGRRADRILE